MCYSAEAWTLYDAYVKEFGADIDIKAFWEIPITCRHCSTSSTIAGIRFTRS